jgi:hypothetical protein
MIINIGYTNAEKAAKSWTVGDTIYNKDTGDIETYNGSSWTVVVGGSFSFLNFVNQSGNINAGSNANTQYYYSFSASGQLTLPTAIANTCIYTVKNASVVNITVVFTGGQNADGTTTITIIPQQSLTFISNNTNYDIN